MDFVAWFIAWLDWQSDRHLDVTAMAAVTMVDYECTPDEAFWWACDPIRTRALAQACFASGLMRYPGWWGYDYDVKDLVYASNSDWPRTLFEVKWTLDRLRNRRWGVIP